jgi:predicted phage tail protein
MKCEVAPTVTEVVGDLVVLDCDELHTPNAGIRTGKRIVQVVSRETTVDGYKLDLLDMGPYLNAVSVPTVSIASSPSDPKHTMRITISGLGINDYELQMARGIAHPSTLDFYTVASGTDTTVDVGGLPSGTGWTVRARALGPQRVRSDWSVVDNASTATYDAPTGVTATATDNEIALSWTIPTGQEDLDIEVWYDTNGPTFSDSTATLWETYQGGTTAVTISGLATTTLYYCYVRFIGPYGGYGTMASDSDTTGVTAGTLTAPDEIYIELGSNITTRTAT